MLTFGTVRWLAETAAVGVVRRAPAHALAFAALIVGVFTVTLVGSTGSMAVAAVERGSTLVWGRAPTVQVRFVRGASPHEVRRWVSFAERVLPRYRPAAVELELTELPVGVRVGEVFIPEVRARSASARRLWPAPVLRGRWYSASSDLPLGIVLNEPAARLAGRAGPVRVFWDRAEREAAVVVGVVDDGSTAPVAYLPLERVPPWVWNGAQAVLHVSLPGEDEGKLLGLLQLLRLGWGPDAPVGELAPTSPFRRGEREVTLLATVFLGLAAVSLVLAALAVANAGLNSVRERTRELLLRKAFGATGPQLAALVLLEAAFVAAAAAAVAVPASYFGHGYLSGALLGRYGLEAGDFPAGWAAIGLAAGVVAALAGASVPAIRAARLPVAAAMGE